KQQLQYIIEPIASFQQTILQLAHHHLHTIIPPYTHLQPPQPISFPHHIITYCWMLERDKARFMDTLKRIDI
ncbi:lyase family protein, partial [Staphylococcus epidermidis]|uniref:lyase family protein n=1 Tax=Staphylococcus epidermidis TaxID=1282 RepID=UPI0021B226C5